MGKTAIPDLAFNKLAAEIAKDLWIAELERKRQNAYSTKWRNEQSRVSSMDYFSGSTKTISDCVNEARDILNESGIGCI